MTGQDYLMALGVMGGLLIIAILALMISKAANDRGKEKYGEEQWKRMMQAASDAQDRKKYDNYTHQCPECGSRRVRKISSDERMRSVAFWGIGSSKIGKSYECDNCHHKW